MAKTIIQTIGPLYGEAVNGTVFGRPNGSVYVPATNTITLTVNNSCTVTVNASKLVISPRGSIFAEAQDLASYLYLQLYTDSDCTVPVGSGRLWPAGSFNVYAGNAGNAGEDTITPGVTYYLRAQLMNSGVAVATSNVYEVVGA